MTEIKISLTGWDLPVKGRLTLSVAQIFPPPFLSPCLPADSPKLEKGGSENRRPEGGGDGKDARATVYPPELLA